MILINRLKIFSNLFNHNINKICIILNNCYPVIKLFIHIAVYPC